MKFWIAFFYLFLCGIAFATPPVQFTGRLTNDGVPFDGVVNLTVKSYASIDDEVELWTEVFENVDVVDGAFRLSLLGRMWSKSMRLELTVCTSASP